MQALLSAHGADAARTVHRRLGASHLRGRDDASR
jgi:hypothetical protein